MSLCVRNAPEFPGRRQPFWQVGTQEAAVAYARLQGYGVSIVGWEIHRGGKSLGPLAGARAEVSSGDSRITHGLVSMRSRQVSATISVVAGDGTVHQQRLHSAGQVRRALDWVVRFNALAEHAQTAEAAPAAPQFGSDYDSPEARKARFLAARHEGNSAEE